MVCELPFDVREQIRQLMATGRYATEADVLRDALAALRRRNTELAAPDSDRLAAPRVRPFGEADAAIRKLFGFAPYLESRHGKGPSGN
jgi:Arc/MetJ-type ribon-helix-helix transcriptional regulator